MGLKRLSSVNIHTSHISEHEQKLAVISEVQQKKVCTAAATELTPHVKSTSNFTTPQKKLSRKKKQICV